MRDIGKNIRDLREQKHMTQDALAEKIFVTRQTVSNYETGRSRPDIDMLIKIAGVLDVDINEILYGPEDKAGHRKKILVTMILAIVMAVLGLLVMVFGEYADIIKTINMSWEVNMIIRLYIQPAYFFLLGYLFMCCVRWLQKAKPLHRRLRKSLLLGVLAICIFFSMLLLPHLSNIILSLLNMQGLSLPEWWWKISGNILRIQTLVWFNLILGMTLGTTSNWSQA